MTKKILILTIFLLLITLALIPFKNFFFTSKISHYKQLTYKDKKHLINTIYKERKNEKTKNYNKYKKLKNPVMLKIRKNGKEMDKTIVKGKDILTNLKTASQKLKKKTPESNLPELNIEIFVFGKKEKIEHPQNFEKGLHSIQLVKGNKKVTYENTIAIEKNYNTPELTKKLWGNLCEKANLPKNCYSKEETNLYHLKTLHFGNTFHSEKITTFYRTTPVSRLNKYPKTRKDIQKSIRLGINWIKRNFREKGLFLYRYSIINGYKDKNNSIRQLMTTKLVGKLSKSKKKLKKFHKKNLEFIFDKYRYEENNKLGYIYLYDKSKLGANAIALSALTKSPYYQQYKEKAKKLAEGILYLQNKDGSLQPWYISPFYDYDEEYLLYFYSGEAILGLIEYYQKTGKEKYLEAAIKSQEYYIEKYVKQMDKNFYPAYVPWHTICMNKLFKITGEKKYAKAIFKLNDKLLKIQNKKGKTFKDFMGRFYNPKTPEYGSPHTSSDGIYTEGFLYAYEIAEKIKDEKHQQRYKKAIQKGIYNLINLQFFGNNTYYINKNKLGIIKGAIKTNAKDNRLRVDNVQHSLNAFLKYLEIF